MTRTMIHMLNNGPENYTIQKCKHSDFELTVRVKCSLHQMDKETDYQTNMPTKTPRLLKKTITGTWQYNSSTFTIQTLKSMSAG